MHKGPGGQLLKGESGSDLVNFGSGKYAHLVTLLTEEDDITLFVVHHSFDAGNALYEYAVTVLSDSIGSLETCIGEYTTMPLLLGELIKLRSGEITPPLHERLRIVLLSRLIFFIRRARLQRDKISAPQQVWRAIEVIAFALAFSPHTAAASITSETVAYQALIESDGNSKFDGNLTNNAITREFGQLLDRILFKHCGPFEEVSRADSLTAE